MSDAPLITIPEPETGPSHRLSFTDPSTMLALGADIAALVNVFANPGQSWQTTTLKAIGVVVAGVWSMVTVNAKHRMTTGLASIAARLAPLAPVAETALAPILTDPSVTEALDSADAALKAAHDAITHVRGTA